MSSPCSSRIREKLGQQVGKVRQRSQRQLAGRDLRPGVVAQDESDRIRFSGKFDQRNSGVNAGRAVSQDRNHEVSSGLLRRNGGEAERT